MYADIHDLPPEQMTALVALAMAAGTLYCFLGYRTLKFVLGLTGFLLAGTVAAVLLGLVSAGNPVAMAIGGLIGGIAGAFALFFLYKTGIFFLGLLGAVLVAHTLLDVRPEAWVPVAVLAAGVIGGLLALWLQRPVIMVLSAAIGAWFIVAGMAFFFMGADWLEEYSVSLEVPEGRPILLAAWAVLTAMGGYTQWVTRPREKREG